MVFLQLRDGQNGNISLDRLNNNIKLVPQVYYSIQTPLYWWVSPPNVMIKHSPTPSLEYLKNKFTQKKKELWENTTSI